MSVVALVTLVTAQQLPSLRVSISPVFNASDVDFLNITLKINNLKIRANT
jgi:hypothetical protein